MIHTYDYNLSLFQMGHITKSEFESKLTQLIDEGGDRFHSVEFLIKKREAVRLELMEENDIEIASLSEEDSLSYFQTH